MDCSYYSYTISGHTATVQYLVKETSAQVNATDDVSHSNNGVFSVETAILFLYSCIINVSRVHNGCMYMYP